MLGVSRGFEPPRSAPDAKRRGPLRGRLWRSGRGGVWQQTRPEPLPPAGPRERGPVGEHLSNGYGGMVDTLDLESNALCAFGFKSQYP